jgi:MFS-type transporter involved in bile tolerance (Atg22 family)
VVTTAVFAVYPLMTQPWLMGVCAVMAGLSIGSVQPMIMSLLHQLTPPSQHGEALGLRLMTINASSVVMPMLFGTASAWMGVGALFWLCALAVGLGSSMAWTTRVPEAQSERPLTSGSNP